MKALARNKQTIYYALYKSKTNVYDTDGLYTGGQSITYEAPVKTRMNVSPGKGEADVAMFGIDVSYSRVMVTDDLSCPIAEDSVVWIDETPNLTNDNFNYRVVRVAKSLNSIKYAIQELET